MSWVKLDDAFPEHRKVEPLTDAAFRCFVESIAYSNRALTDGFIDRRVVTRRWAEAAIDELVDGGLWERAAGGFVIHDYLDYQPSRARVEIDRDAARARMRRLRPAADNRSAGVRANSDRSGGEVPEHSRAGSVTPDPDPDPDPDQIERLLARSRSRVLDREPPTEAVAAVLDLFSEEAVEPLPESEIAAWLAHGISLDGFRTFVGEVVQRRRDEPIADIVMWGRPKLEELLIVQTGDTRGAAPKLSMRRAPP